MAVAGCQGPRRISPGTPRGAYHSSATSSMARVPEYVPRMQHSHPDTCHLYHNPRDESIPLCNQRRDPWLARDGLSVRLSRPHRVPPNGLR